MKRKIFLLILGLIIIGVYSQNQTELKVPDSSIRLRVIPNSNNSKDINIKEQVKDYLETDIYTLLKNTDNIDSARTIINNNIPKIETNIDNIFKNNNYNIPYEINFGLNYFPEKTYNGEIYEEYVLDVEDEFEHELMDLPKYDENGKLYEYTVQQKEVLDGYETFIEGFEIINVLNMYDFQIEYYFDGVLDEEKTDYLSGYYKDTIVDYEDKSEGMVVEFDYNGKILSKKSYSGKNNEAFKENVEISINKIPLGSISNVGLTPAEILSLEYMLDVEE